MIDVPKNLTLRRALEILPELGWSRRDMDGRHERWQAPNDGRVRASSSLTIARTGKGGMNSLAPGYMKSIIRREVELKKAS